jgi:hypothetical protein
MAVSFMKHFIGIPFILYFHFGAVAQNEPDPYQQGIKQLNKIINLIKTDNAHALAELVSYPLKRPNPIPDINTKKEFIAYYPILFDTQFKQKLIDTKFTPSNNTKYHNSAFGIFNGDMWLYKNGKIECINHISPEESSMVLKLTKEIQQKMPHSILSWKENLYVCKTSYCLIRIDNQKQLPMSPTLYFFMVLRNSRGILNNLVLLIPSKMRTGVTNYMMSGLRINILAFF